MERHKFDGEKNRAYIMELEQQEMQRQQRIESKKAQIFLNIYRKLSIIFHELFSNLL